MSYFHHFYVRALWKYINMLTGQVGKKCGERGKATIEQVQQWVEMSQICMQKCHVWLHPPRYLKRQTLVSSEGRSLYSGPLRIIFLVFGGQVSHLHKETDSKGWDPTQTARSRDRTWITLDVKDLRAENFKTVCLLLKGIKCLLFRIATFERGLSKPACKELGSYPFYLQVNKMKINSLS